MYIKKKTNQKLGPTHIHPKLNYDEFFIRCQTEGRSLIAKSILSYKYLYSVVLKGSYKIKSAIGLEVCVLKIKKKFR
ncbi:hypothetical protein DD592_27425 [Enterobacter cloacae complex sp. 2DZ2F20B]|nr:hypothetical protein DD592_27425 [Enterobacter cloacae complex sp. 2DZ2F20B]